MSGIAVASGLSRPGGPLRVVLLAALCLAACESPRDRPVGVRGPVTTSVTVAAPEPNSLVASDSSALVVVQASGAVRAIEYVITRAALPDTLARGRRQFEVALETVEVLFVARIPGLETGINLEIRGVAEGAAGERTLSEPVFVTVIECDLFPLACEDLGGQPSGG